MNQTLLYSSFPGLPSYIPVHIFMSDDNKSNKPANKENLFLSSFPGKEAIRVMLADDDSDDRDMFAEAAGHVQTKLILEQAVNGGNLIDQLTRATVLPDVIFLDLNMPDKTGFECLEIIRHDARLKNIPVVIYSTSSSPKDIDETFRKGANLYIKKPTSFQELLHILEKVPALNWSLHQPGGAMNSFVYTPKISK